MNYDIVVHKNFFITLIGVYTNYVINLTLCRKYEKLWKNCDQEGAVKSINIMLTLADGISILTSNEKHQYNK